MPSKQIQTLSHSRLITKTVCQGLLARVTGRVVNFHIVENGIIYQASRGVFSRDAICRVVERERITLITSYEFVWR